MRIQFLPVAVAALFLLINPASAQSEECRQISGLPIKIGEPLICGQVKIRGLGPTDPRPSIQVTLLLGGVSVETA